MAYDYDLLVIGAGSGGVRASRVAASLGAKVAVVESGPLGGTCVNVGCVPKKLFVYGAHFPEDFHSAAGYGWQLSAPTFDWPTLRDHKNTEILRLNGIYQNLLDNAGVELLLGKAAFVNSNCVAVKKADGGEQQVTAKHILIATGGHPSVAKFPGSEHCITSNDAFYLSQLPEKIVVYGGGYIAVEFAGIFHGLGVETHLVYRGPLFLRGFDEGVRQHLATTMAAKGIHLHFNTTIENIEKQGESLNVVLSSGEKLAVGEVMAATGRKALVEPLALENTSVSCRDNGSIIVDEHYQTSDDAIFAIGDVKGGPELTPVAIVEGNALAQRLFGKAINVNYNNIATAIFSQPNIGTVGLSEAQALEQYGDVAVYESTFRPMKNTLGGSEEKSYLKLLVDVASDKVIGCHMVGPEAGEIIQGLAVAITAGATKRDFDDTMAIHPTTAEEFVTMKTSRPAH